MTYGLLPTILPIMSRDDLLAEIRAFLARKDVSMCDSTFGRRAVNDGKLLDRLDAGGSVTLETAEKIRAFISRYRAPARAA